MLMLLLACAPEGGPGTLTTTDHGWYLPFGTEGEDAGWSVLPVDGGEGGPGAVAVTHRIGADGTPDIAIYRVDAAGTVLWSQEVGDAGAERAWGAAAADGVIYVAGSSGEGAAEDALVVALQAEDGLPLWMWERDGGFGTDRAADIATDGTALWVAGQTETDPATGQGQDAWLVKLGLDGTELWAQSWGGQRQEEAAALALAGTRVYVAGRMDGGAGQASGGDAMIVSFDAAGGRVVWERRLGDDIALWDAATSVAAATDEDGAATALYVGGATAGDSFEEAVWALSAEGDLQWSLIGGGDGADRVETMTVTDRGLLLGATTASEADGAGAEEWAIRLLPLAGPDPEAEDSGVRRIALVGGAEEDALHDLAISGDTLWMIGDSGSAGAGGMDALLVTAPAREESVTVLE